MAIIKTVEVSGIEVIDAYWYITRYVIEADRRTPFCTIQLRAYKDKAARDSFESPLGGEEFYKPYNIPFNLVAAALVLPDGEESALDKIYDYIVNNTKEVLKPGLTRTVVTEENEGVEQQREVYIDTDGNVIEDSDAFESYFANCEIVS